MTRTATGWRVGAVVALLASAVLAGCGGHQDQRVDATTATAAPPSLPPTAPTALTRRAWSAPHPADLPVAVDGGYAVIADRHGVSVRDAATGRERWHYHDPRHALVDDQGEHQVVTGGGHVLVRFAAPHGQLVRVFDLPTGQPRHDVSTPSAADTALVDAGHLYLTGAVPGGAPVRAVDLSDGRPRWSFTPRCADGGVQTDLNPWLVGAGGAAPALLVAGSCGPVGGTSTVTALSTGTGRVLWQVSAAGSPADRMADGGPSALPAGAPVVVVDAAAHRYTIVDTATGRATTTAANGDLQPTTAANLWCTTNVDTPVSCFDTTGRLRWQHPLPGTTGTDRYPGGLAATQPPTATPTVLAVLTETTDRSTSGQQISTATIELLRADTGQPIVTGHQLPGASTTLTSGWPHRFALYAYGPAGLFLSTRTTTSNTATLIAYH